MEVEVQQFVIKLEAAAGVILALSPSVDQKQRESAELVFMNFRKSKSPYEICKYIFENSKTDYVIFEAANSLKEAIIREWSMLNTDDVTSLWQYLLRHVINNAGMAVFVREKMLQVISIIIKRSSIGNEDEERSKLLLEVEQMLLSGDLHKQIVACSLLLALLQEYAVTIKSTDVGLTWEAHIESKSQFEVTDLRMIFKLCMRMLAEISQVEGAFPNHVLIILKLLLQIVENILTWHFVSLELHKNITHLMETNYEAEYALPLKLATGWKDIILDPQVVELFFHLHWKIRDNPQLTHCTLNCLSQLASLSGPVMSDVEAKKKYVIQFLEYFIKLTSNCMIMDREALGVSYMADKLHVNSDMFFVNEIPRHLYYRFIREICDLTCSFSQRAANDDSADYDVSLYDEAFNVMVKVWNKIFKIFSIIKNERDFPDEMYRDVCAVIFDNFLTSRLSPPNGLRFKVYNDSKEMDELDEDDKVKYEAQLECIASFSMKLLDYALPTLAKFIDERTDELKNLCQRSDVHEQERIVIFEDLHWLIMLAGHILTQEFHPQDNEVIPESIKTYSLSQSSVIDVNTSLRLLTVTDCQAVSAPERRTLAERSDHVIWLISSILRISSLETNLVEKQLLDRLSPLLSSSILWFLKVWSQIYLFCEETEYNISYIFVAAFSENSPLADSLVELILHKIYTNLKLYSSDKNVSEDTASLLVAFVKNKSRASCIVNKDTYWNIMRLREDVQLSNSIKRDIMSAFVFAGVGVGDEECYTYYNQILKPLTEELKAILYSQYFSRDCHSEHIKSQICNITDTLIGSLLGITASQAAPVSTYIMPLLPDLVSLINHFRNYHEMIHLILEFFDTFTDSLLGFLSETDSHNFYAICMKLVEIYVYFSSGTASAEKMREEIMHDDLSTFIRIVTNILTKDIIEIQIVENTTQNCIAPVDVCMYSLKGLLPIMNVDLLKFPELCTNYFTLLLYACELHAEKICTEPREFILGILATVELGLTTLNTTRLCCDIIYVLVKFISTNSNLVPQLVFEIVRPFTDILLSLILSQQINSECIPNLSNALFCLICCYKDYFSTLVDKLVNLQPDEEIRQRLCKEFVNLTRNVNADLTKASRMNFLKAFEVFTKNTQGFLFIK